MPTYIQLLTLTSEGRAQLLEDGGSVLRAQAASTTPGVVVLGLYAVLGDYDFVNIVEAPDNDSVGRFSLDLGVRAGVHIITLPTIPISRLEKPPEERPPGLEAERGLSSPITPTD